MRYGMATGSPVGGPFPCAPAEEVRGCLLRHLALAAEDLVREGRADGRSHEFAHAAARWRDLADRPWLALARRGVADVAPGADLADLLWSSWQAEGHALPGRGVDPDLREAARELLLGLSWALSPH